MVPYTFCTFFNRNFIGLAFIGGGSCIWRWEDSQHLGYVYPSRYTSLFHSPNPPTLHTHTLYKLKREYIYIYFSSCIMLYIYITKSIFNSGMMPDKSTGDVAADGYHKYKVFCLWRRRTIYHTIYSSTFLRLNPVPPKMFKYILLITDLWRSSNYHGG